jgi:four helix bundle protein
MHNYKELKVWQKSMELTVKVYQLTNMFPDSEKYNLTSQARRSAVSIPSNIAEGAGRHTKADFSRFLDIAYGSSSELDTQLILSQRLNFLKEDNLNEMADMINHIQKMITNLKNSLS